MTCAFSLPLRRSVTLPTSPLALMGAQEPQDGAEYLRRVRAEAADLPSVLQSNHLPPLVATEHSGYNAPDARCLSHRSPAVSSLHEPAEAINEGDDHNAIADDSEPADTTLDHADPESTSLQHTGFLSASFIPCSSAQQEQKQHHKRLPKFQGVDEWESLCKQAFADVRQMMRSRSGDAHRKRVNSIVAPQRIARQAAASWEQHSSIAWLVERHDPIVSDLLQLSEHEKLALLLMLADVIANAPESSSSAEVARNKAEEEKQPQQQQDHTFQAEHVAAVEDEEQSENPLGTLDLTRACKWAFAVLLCVRDTQAGVSVQAVNKLHRACVAHERYTASGLPASLHTLLCACEASLGM